MVPGKLVPASDSALGWRFGSGIVARIGALLLLSTVLYVGAAFYAVIVTNSAVAAGDGVPWSKVLASFIVVTVVAGALLVVTLRRFAGRLRSISSVLRSISAGDLTARVSDRSADEIGEMSRAVDATVEHTQAVLTTVHRATKTLRKGWEEVEEVGLAMSAAAETTCVEALAAATAAEQVSNSIHVVAAATEQLGATVREVAVHASEAAAVATTAAEQAALASYTVLELGSASQRVGEITNLITSIAGQTHLLALNATIEAARAGEMGRGFAVVAGEVKDLARETAKATETVNHTVSEIQSGSGRATSAIGEITSTIAMVSENQSAIASAVVEQTAATNEISRVSADAAHGSSAIAVNIARVSDSARSTAYAGGQARTTAADLAALETSLAALLDSFTVGGIEEIVLEQSDDNALGTTVVDGVTIIQDGVKGTALNEFDYRGEGWRHSTGNLRTGGTNTYNCTPDAVAVLRFVGTRIRLYGINDPSHGMGAASVDDAPETIVDMYSPERESGKVSWESPVLPHGEHRFELRIANQKNPESRYFWVAVDRVEID